MPDSFSSARQTPPSQATRSVWRDRHPRLDEDAGALPAESEVVVVGAGLAGVTTALLLARAGREVTLVEARHMGSGTTGASTAKVSLLQGTRLSSIARHQSPEVVAAYVAANREAQAWLLRFCAEHQVDVDRRPALSFATTERGRRRLRREQQVAEAAGLPVRWDHGALDPSGLVGPDAIAVLGLADQAQVDPLALLEALLEEAVRHGVRLVEDARVRGVHGGSDGAQQVVTEQGDVRARRVVVATNLPFLDRAGFFARMAPVRSSALALTLPPDQELTVPMALGVDGPGLSLRDADGGATLLVGGAGHPTGRGGSTTARLDVLRAWAAERVPQGVETHAWSAQDWVPARSLPFAGPLLPGGDAVWMVGGFAKWGMTNAVAAALVLAARLEGGALAEGWGAVYDPWRLPGGPGARAALGGWAASGAQAALINAEVGVELTRGWLAPVVRRAGGSRPLATGEGRVEAGASGRPVARARTDRERAVSGVCTHLGGVVAWNDAERSWDCPLHGSRFDVDGAVLDAPATCGLRRLL